jgi:hypothetical protein
MEPVLAFRQLTVRWITPSTGAKGVSHCSEIQEGFLENEHV